MRVGHVQTIKAEDCPHIKPFCLKDNKSLGEVVLGSDTIYIAGPIHEGPLIHNLCTPLVTENTKCATHPTKSNLHLTEVVTTELYYISVVSFHTQGTIIFLPIFAHLSFLIISLT
jgi:hypothetical protein